MYGIVLMMAMTSAPDTPEFGRHKGDCCGGCTGCTGCYGGCYGGCSGCYGGCNGCHGGHARRERGCHGCHGGCSGCYGGGCYGGGYGSCTGCYGGGYASDCGCGAVSYGCTGCWGGYSAPMMGAQMMGAPMKEGAKTMPAPAPADKKEPPKPPTEASIAGPATIIVSLPANATLTFDGAPTASTSSIREFITPSLQQGQTYGYTLAAQVVRDGKTVNATQRVTVRAGETTRVELVPGAFGTALASR